MSKYGKQIRLRRFFRHGRTVIIPMDHPMYGGPVPGLEDPASIVEKIAKTEADGILISPWLIQRVSDVAKQLAICARLDGGNSSLGKHIDQACNVVSVEQALQFGAEMVAVNIFVGGDNEPDMFKKLGDTAMDCERWGMPLLAEMIPSSALEHHYGRQAKGKKDPTKEDPVEIVTRMGAEYGGDMIKTIFSGNIDEFKRVIKHATVPVVVAGGPKTGSDSEFLTMVKDCMQAGAAGITMGRNVWQRPRIEGMIAALCAIVHHDASVKEALGLL